MNSESALLTPNAKPDPETHAAPAASPGIPKPWLVLPALTSVLLCLCYRPIGWGFLGWVALVPLLMLVRLNARPRQIYFGAYLGGCLFFFVVLQWMTVADYRMVYTWIMLATYCAAYFPAAIFFIRRLDRATRWPLTITVPLVWVGLEFVRSFMLTGFAWYYLGHTQQDYLPVIQIADLGGAYAVSYVLAAVSGWLVEFLLAFPEIARLWNGSPEPYFSTGGSGEPPYKRQSTMSPPFPRRRLGFIPLVLVGATLLYGGWRLNQETFRPGPRVALLQGNLDQRLRNEADADPAKALHASQEVLKYYWQMCGLAATQFPTPDIIIWPETSFPYHWFRLPSDLNKISDDVKEEARLVHGLLREMTKDAKTNVLFGLNSHAIDADGKKDQYNSALLMSPSGDVQGIYDKIHPVPFGEYVPLRGWLPFMDRFAPYDFDYGITIGDKRTRLKLGDYRFGVIICNEDTDPFLARNYGRDEGDGPAVDFLINISNDGWFDGSSEHGEHLAISRFRAIEARRPIARAVNMGISAVIDSNGRVQKPHEYPVSDAPKPDDSKLWAVVEGAGGIPELPPSEWRDFTQVRGVLLATIPLDSRTSFYAWAGDWLPGGCWLVVLGVWLWRMRARTSGDACATAP